MMTVLATDTFTDIDGTTLQLHNEGVAWTRHPARAADYVIDTNRIRTLAAVANRTLYYSDVIPPSPDYSVEAIVDLLTDNNVTEVGITVRTDTAVESHYFLTVALSSNTVNLGKHVAGVSTTLDNAAIVPANMTIRLRVEGNVITGYVDDVEVVNAIDNDIAAVGRPGVRAFNNCPVGEGVQISEWSVLVDDVVNKRSTFPIGRIGRVGT